MCSCNTALMTSQHLLQHCSLQDTLRKNVWPEDLALTEQLYGDLESLRRTAALTVRETGVSVEVYASDEKTLRGLWQPFLKTAAFAREASVFI